MAADLLSAKPDIGEPSSTPVSSLAGLETAASQRGGGVWRGGGEADRVS